MKIVIVLLLSAFCFATQAESLRIATGEYVPYTGENIPNQGISSMVVRAVFKELKQDIHLEFMPWKRVMMLVENGTVDGSYPWSANSERLKNYYFSTPIHQYRIFSFTKKGNEFNTAKSLTGKTICIPDGWDKSPFNSLIEKSKMKVFSPGTVESCFGMLALGRVDIIFINELVGKYVVDKLFGKKSPLVASEKDYLREGNELHFMVSRKSPNGKKIISDFNRGLERIKANGVYDAIVSVISTCVTCNQLGSL
ncbi:transporter substrate-binding domain-containing protein [Bacteriovorax sp. PP10]|uniref:Transporter substrate-binding domain-containing protein n=1 Tax=Bacteriovorax antarcticus TaxID=3088717 RepID=A0ABU5VXY9_9BACT|nr:transporter substrate-binding domain-containing protein [Bacteriovorax sp. PP10]MEA9357871.1 transporter substrate-binding domain-containing protein [Bacteriovorax sp. PP10]